MIITSLQKMVIETQCSESMSFPLSVMVLAQCIMWWWYGYLIGDFFVQVVVLSLGSCSLVLTNRGCCTERCFGVITNPRKWHYASGK